MRLGSVVKMRMSILTTATTEQMGYGSFSFFVYTKSIYESLCNLNMIVDIFTLSLNVSIYNEGNMPDEILITGGIYVKGHT